jgi:simple sugar transport system permease protein
MSERPQRNAIGSSTAGAAQATATPAEPDVAGPPAPEPADERVTPEVSRWHAFVAAVPRFVAALAATLAVVSVVILIFGADPVAVARAVVEGSLGDPFVLGQTIMVTGILTLTGLAAAIPFRAGLWNVGGEGQLYAGAIGAVAVALLVSPNLNSVIALILVMLASIVAGALWGAIAGALKATLDLNEVIVSLMLSFIAILAADYVVRGIWPEGISPQTKRIPDNTVLPMIWQQGLVTIGPVIALVFVIAGWFLIRHTTLGFSIRAVGFNPKAARLSGISAGWIAVSTFAIGGAVAGLAGGMVVSGVSNALVAHFSPNYGFLGIAVALIARLEPLWLVPAAFVFSALRVGSNGLEVDIGLSSAVGDVIVTTFIISLLFFRIVKLPTSRAGL